MTDLRQDPKREKTESRRTSDPERETEEGKACEALCALEAYWWWTDPEFERKAPLLNEYGKDLARRVVQGEVHPSRVVGLVQDHYNAITRAMRPAVDTRCVVH